MILFPRIYLTQKWAIASYLCRQSITNPSFVAVNSVLKSHFSVKSTESDLRTYLNAIKNVKHITDNELNEILSLLRRDQLVDVDALDVLKCCSSKHVRQTHVLDSIWTELKTKSAPLNVQHYNALLRLYIEKEKKFSSRAMFDEIIGRGTKPNVSTCNLLILSCAMRGDVNGMSEIFTIMKAKEMRVDCDTLNNLLKGYAKVGDAEMLNATFDLFKTENVELLNSDILNVITNLDANGHTDKIDVFFNRLFKSIDYQHSAKAFISNSVRNRRFEMVMKLLSNNDDRYPLVSMAQYYLSEAVDTSCTADDINRVWCSLEALNITIDSNIDAYYPAALRSSSSSLVRETLYGMQEQSLPIRDEHFVHLCHLESAKSPDAVLDIMRHMIHGFNVQPSCTMIRDTFLPLYVSNKEPQMALAKLLTLDISITIILTAFITRCILDSRLGDAVHIANMYKNHHLSASQYRPYLTKAIQNTEDFDNFVNFMRMLRDDVEHVNAVRKASETVILKQQVQVVSEIIRDAIISLNGDSNKIRMLLERVLSEGLQISKNVTKNILQELEKSVEKSDPCIASLLYQLSATELMPRPLPKSEHVSSPLELLSTDELITIIESAESRGKKRRPSKSHVNETNMLEANEQFMDSSNIFSKKIYSDMISYCMKQSVIDTAADYFERGQTECDNLNLSQTHAMQIIVMLLLRGHKYVELKQMMIAKGVSNSFVDKKIPSVAVSLLRAATDSGDIDLTRELFEYFIANDYIKPTVWSTSALVKVQLQNDNVVDAFNMFEDIYEKYKCTPQKMQLCCKLIERDDMNRLQRLFDIIVAAHNEHLALRVLGYAFIDAGQIKQAAFVLSNPILVHGYQFLWRDCEYHYQRGRINILEGILAATKDIDYDRTGIYRYLFLHYLKTNQRQQATHLFAAYENEKNSLSDEFLFEIKSFLSTESMFEIGKEESVNPKSISNDVKTVAGVSEEQNFSGKMRNLLRINPAIMSQYLTKVADMGNSIVAIAEMDHPISNDELWDYSDVRNSPNINKVYLQALQNSSNPTRYIQKLEELVENAGLNAKTAKYQINEIKKFVCIEDNLRFLQKHPHVINEFEAMAIKATNWNIYAPLNVIWIYSFMLESSVIESMWWHHFETQPNRFQSNQFVQIFEKEKCHAKLEKLTAFLAAKDRLSEAANAINARLRLYVDANCFTEANRLLETAPISLRLVDRTILSKRSNGGNFPSEDFLIREKSLSAELTSNIEKTEGVFTANESNAVKSIRDIREEQELNGKMRNLMKINPMIMSYYLNKVADIGNTIVIYDQENYSEIRNSPNINQLYLQALRNGANPERYIHKLEESMEIAGPSTESAQHRISEINKFVCVEENLRFLQEHPHVINEFEAMAIKAAKLRVYAPINVIWMYHFMSESPFIENLWVQHFATQPEHFQTKAMLRILESEKSHEKLKNLIDFLVTKNRLRDAGCATNECLRIYVDKNGFNEATEWLKKRPALVEYVDRTILHELKRCFEANGRVFPISIDPI